MRSTQAPPVPFGRHLGAATRTSSDLLDAIMVREAERSETWIVLNLIATSGPGKRRDDLVRELVSGLRFVTEAPAEQILGQAERHGLIHVVVEPDGTGGLVALTPAGEERFSHLLAAINQASDQALSGIEPEDVQTTIRVLGQYRVNALALLAG